MKIYYLYLYLHLKSSFPMKVIKFYDDSMPTKLSFGQKSYKHILFMLELTGIWLEVALTVIRFHI